MSVFPDTQWTLILKAATSQTSDGLAALDQLCRRYWAPLHAYARMRGYSPADAEDITQAFFAGLLANKTHTKAVAERGRFRTFLLHAMQNFIANHYRDAKRLKRGGAVAHENVDDYANTLSTEQTPETLYDQKWAQALITSAIIELENEYRTKGWVNRFATMRPLLSVRHEGDATALAESLNVSVANFRKLLQQFRQRFGVLVREEVRRLTNDPSEVDDELAHLMRALAA